MDRSPSSPMGRAHPWEAVGTRDSGAPTHPHIGTFALAISGSAFRNANR